MENNSFKEDFKALSEVMEKKSTMTLREFLPFIDLYRRSEDMRDILSNQERYELSLAFSEKVSLYNELKIVDDDGNELFTLPKVLNTINSIAFDDEFNKPMSVLLRPMASPKHSAEATKRILDLLVASQGKNKEEYINKIKNEKNRFAELVEKIKNIKTIELDSDEKNYKNIPDEIIEGDHEESLGVFTEE